MFIPEFAPLACCVNAGGYRARSRLRPDHTSRSAGFKAFPAMNPRRGAAAPFVVRGRVRLHLSLDSLTLQPASGSQRARLDACKLRRDLPALAQQVVVGLKTEPEAIGQPEIPGEAQIRVRGHRALAEDDLVDPSGRHADGAGETVLGQAHRLDKVELQDVPRRGVGDFVSGNRRFRHGRDLPVSIRSRCAIAG
jgi:hypothetical protein